MSPIFAENWQNVANIHTSFSAKWSTSYFFKLHSHWNEMTRIETKWPIKRIFSNIWPSPKFFLVPKRSNIQKLYKIVRFIFQLNPQWKNWTDHTKGPTSNFCDLVQDLHERENGRTWNFVKIFRAGFAIEMHWHKVIQKWATNWFLLNI